MTRIAARDSFCKCCGSEMDANRCVRGTVCGICKSQGHTYFDCEKCRQALEEEMRSEENPSIVMVGIDDAGRKRILELFHSGFLGVLPSTGMIVDCREHPEALPVQNNGSLAYLLKPNLEDLKKFKEVFEAFKCDRETRKQMRRRFERDQSSRPQAYPKNKLIKDGRYKWKIKKK